MHRGPHGQLERVAGIDPAQTRPPAPGRASRSGGSHPAPRGEHAQRHVGVMARRKMPRQSVISPSRTGSPFRRCHRYDTPANGVGGDDTSVASPASATRAGTQTIVRTGTGPGSLGAHVGLHPSPRAPAASTAAVADAGRARAAARRGTEEQCRKRRAPELRKAPEPPGEGEQHADVAPRSYGSLRRLSTSIWSGIARMLYARRSSALCTAPPAGVSSCHTSPRPSTIEACTVRPRSVPASPVSPRYDRCERAFTSGVGYQSQRGSRSATTPSR